MRWIRLAPWVLCLLFVATCGEKTTAPKSGAVGRVLSLEGKASAQRNNEPARELAIDDVIFVGDTITTGEASSVLVSLTHNGAEWTIPPNSTRKIRESKAFRATKSSSIAIAAKDVHGTSAAGRHAEKVAGETGSTAAARPLEETMREESTDGEEPMTSAPPPPPPAPAEDVAAPEPIVDRSANRRRNKRPRAPERRTKSASNGGGGGSSRSTAASPPSIAPTSAPMPEARPKPTKTLETTGADADEVTAKGGESSTTREEENHLRKLLKTCRAKHTAGSGSLSYRYRAGRITVSASVDSLAPLATCLQAAARKSPPPGPKTSAGVLRVR